MSKINPLYERGDVKYFRKEHIKRMELVGEQPTSYHAFYSRLRKGMSLREAIYTPSNTKMVRHRYNMKPKRGWSKFKSNLRLLRFRFISFLKH